LSLQKTSLKYRIGIAGGIAAPIVAFACIIAAIASYPQFSWTDNALSDLGVVTGITGPLFNFGLFSAGVLALIFAALGLFTFMGKSSLGKVGSGFFAAATIALICIGIFNENFSPTHYIVSVAFFMLTPIGLFILTCAFYRNRKRGIAAFTAAIGAVAALPWILQFTIYYVPKVAIPETVSALAFSVWAIVLAKIMLKPQAVSQIEKNSIS
jgi:hypothetical membrane protein